MKYEFFKGFAIYSFIVVAILMTALGVLALWGVFPSDVLWRAFATILVVGLGSLTVAFTASYLDRSSEPEALPSFAPHPAKGTTETDTSRHLAANPKSN